MRKNAIVYSIISLMIMFSLSSCTFLTEYNVKSVAQVSFESQMKKELDSEMQSAIGALHLRGSDFVAYIMSHSKIEIVSITEESPTHYQVEFKITSISPELRRMLLAEMKPITDSHQINSLNFGDFFELMLVRNPGLKLEVERHTILGVRKIDGTWITQ